MSKAMHILVRNARDYDDHPVPLATSTDKALLTEWQEDYKIKRQKKLALNTEASELYYSMLKQNPHGYSEPPQIPKCVVAPRTRKEQNERVKLKAEYATAREEYLKKVDLHDDNIRKKAYAEIRRKHDLPDDYRLSHAFDYYPDVTYSIITVPHIESVDAGDP